MRNHISYTVLGLALIAGASAANAQTNSTQDPVVAVPVAVVTAPVAAPVETVETVRTVRQTTTSARPRIVSRHVVRSRTANRVTTTRTTVTERVIPALAVVAAPAAEAITEPSYSEVVQAPRLAPAYPDRLYDVVTPAPVAAPPPAAPLGAAAFGAGTAVRTYRYVYEPDRILVIDPYTNIAVQAIPR